MCFFFSMAKLQNYKEDHKALTVILIKEFTLCHKLWFSNPNIFGTQIRKPLIFQAYIIWSNKSHSLKFQRFTTLESKDIGIRKSEFVTKSQFLYRSLIHKNQFQSSAGSNFKHWIQSLNCVSYLNPGWNFKHWIQSLNCVSYLNPGSNILLSRS